MMNEYNYSPDIKDENGNLVFHGTIKLKKINWRERQEMRAKLSSLETDLERERYMYEVAEEGIISLDLKAFDGTVIKDFESLMELHEGQLAAIKAATVLTTGIKLGNALG